MALSLDLDRADEVLRQEWNQVLKENESEYVDDSSIRERISKLMNDDRYGVKTFRYMFLSNVLAKVVHPQIHYRAIQTESELQGAFSSRTIAEQVVVDWEQDNGQRLGGSNEPGTNKPFRWAEFSKEMQVMRDDVCNMLTDLLEELEEKTAQGEINPEDVLRQTLYEISQLETQTIDYQSPSEVPYQKLEPIVREYLQVSGGGERLAAVAAAIIRSNYFHAGDGQWEVDAEHVNVPDEQSNAAGDIEVREDGELSHAYEVKDKPVAKNDITHAIEKAQTAELGEYLYLVGAGFKQGEERAAKREAESAPIEMILVYQVEMVAHLKFVGERGREMFVDYVGDYLNEMRATDKNKEAWKSLVEENFESN